MIETRNSPRVVMKQNWRDLLFLHYSIDPQELLKVLPSGLEPDLYPNAHGELKAWIGVVAFHMFGVRPAGLPALPWLSAFAETNVRTYVRYKGRNPGVYFFTLDAACGISCKIARAWYKLPYYHAEMEFEVTPNTAQYESKRYDCPKNAGFDAQVELLDTLPPVQPGSLEHFLIERYRLYNCWEGRLRTAQVEHVSYPLRKVHVHQCQQTLTHALGLPTSPWEHQIFSPGVDTNIFSLEPISNLEGSES